MAEQAPKPDEMARMEPAALVALTTPDRLAEMKRPALSRLVKQLRAARDGAEDKVQRKEIAVAFRAANDEKLQRKAGSAAEGGAPAAAGVPAAAIALDKKAEAAGKQRRREAEKAEKKRVRAAESAEKQAAAKAAREAEKAEKKRARNAERAVARTGEASDN